MPSRRQRITNGHRACVCGLVIAGVTLKVACRIAGVPYKSFLRLVPGWNGRHGRHRKWKGADLAAMRAQWLAGDGSVKIARRFHTHQSSIRRIAQREGWPKRRVGRPAAAGVVPVRLMPPRQRALYRKLRACMPRDVAYREAMAERHGAPA